VRKIFRAAFASSALPYSNPHALRKTLVALAFKLRLPPEEMKAWSQNLGHKRMLTTVFNYADVPPDRQADILRNLAKGRGRDQEEEELVRDVAALVRQRTRQTS
jgi:hypothetical protein